MESVEYVFTINTPKGVRLSDERIEEYKAALAQLLGLDNTEGISVEQDCA